MPIISIHHASAISDEQAIELIAKLTEVYVVVTGANPESLSVIFQPVEPTRWGVGGRTLAARRK